MREITYKTFENLIEKYSQRDDFEQYTIEGCLLDNYILRASGCKTTIVREKYLNEWSSCYEIIMYNKTPKNYEKIIDLLCDDEYSKAEKLFFA